MAGFSGIRFTRIGLKDLFPEMDGVKDPSFFYILNRKFLKNLYKLGC